ncbi:hypothetical protein BE04_00370 [Sorangium cellulosum]|uniref:Uncharacterized protein n=2 Tax=Sorangium cellulosum TaxID=56 RepID=A0A150PTF9_SORCE|nr:hypothetical protein SCE1572_07550 [Sorangium cellulosum So0157-2]KYF58952.1 hypothetical protein BE04_00370 [Sorangium cellulosum]
MAGAAVREASLIATGCGQLLPRLAAAQLFLEHLPHHGRARAEGVPALAPVAHDHQAELDRIEQPVSQHVVTAISEQVHHILCLEVASRTLVHDERVGA